MAKAKKSKAKKQLKKKKAKKIAKRAAAKARSTSVKSKKAKKSKKTKARKAAPRKAKKAAPKKKKQEMIGEGDYVASQTFLKDQSDFVKKNKKKIPALGKEAEEALDGPEGDSLRAAEQEAASRSMPE
jgi:hypothetical protein